MNTTPRRSAVNTNDMLGLLMRDLDRYPMPNYDEQVELAKRVTAGDEEAKKQMVAANLRLVLHWARRYQDRGVEMVDLVQEGTFGLLARGREVRLGARIQVLDLRHLVDPPGAPASRPAARPHDPHPPRSRRAAPAPRSDDGRAHLAARAQAHRRGADRGDRHVQGRAREPDAASRASRRASTSRRARTRRRRWAISSPRASTTGSATSNRP